MSISLVQSNSGVGDFTLPREVVLALSSLTANNVLIVAEVAARATTLTGWSISCTWDGTPMTQAVLEDAPLNGFGSGKSYIFYLAVGNLVAETANVVAVASSSNSAIQIAMTAKAYEDVDQASPINATAGDSVITGSSAIVLNCNSDPTDRVIGCACFAGTSASGASPSDGQTKVTGISDSLGSDIAHVSGDDTAEGGSNTGGNWAGFSSSWSYTMASLAMAAGPIEPMIINISGTTYAGPNVSDQTVNGLNMDPAGVTKLFYADGTNYATATLVEQTITGITSTRLNWAVVSLGSVGEGNNFLFVVTDEGGGGEAVSPAFAVTMAAPFTWTKRIVYLTDGTTGTDILVIPSLEFTNAKAAIIRGNAAGMQDTLVQDAVLCICFVDEAGAKGVCIGSEADPTQYHQRTQVEGTGALVLMHGGTGADLVVGTPSIGPLGLSINFTVNTSGYNLEIFLLGGDHLAVSLDEMAVSSSPFTGLDFRPSVLIGSTVGISSGGGGDSTFAILGFGVAIHQGGLKQICLGADQSNQTARGSALVSTGFLGQFQATSFTWLMAITSIDVGGFTWTDSDNDGVYVMSLYLPDHQLFLGTFNKDNVGGGVEQNLPDVGFDPSAMFLFTAGMFTEATSPAQGSRWSLGYCDSTDQDVSIAFCVPPQNPMTSRQYESFTKVVIIPSVAGVLSAIGEMTGFGQISTIKWTTSFPGVVSLIGLFAIGIQDHDDTEGDYVMVDEIY